METKDSTEALIASLPVSRPVLLAIGTEDDIVWPQPTSAKALLSYHQGEHELWTKKTGHVFDCDKGEDMVNAVIDKSVNFIKAHSEVN